jgi:demethylmenaquinone methyltransferase/2-methoxy-6-polyprenyl-1,4-benzoquinol methylase
MTFPSPEEKRAYVRLVFTRLAPHYERVNQVLSLGQIRAWRKRAADQARVPPGGRALDVATGEGELARALVRRWPGITVVGLDLTEAMIQRGRVRCTGWPIQWVEGDALRLPFPDRSFDAVLSAFMLRNVADVEQAIREQARVVRPGGRVICLEMVWPRHPLPRLYLSLGMPLLGRLLTGDPEPYRYLPRSAEVFLSPEELAATMERAGLCSVRFRRLMMGSVALHVALRPDDPVQFSA